MGCQDGWGIRSGKRPIRVTGCVTDVGTHTGRSFSNIKLPMQQQQQQQDNNDMNKKQRRHEHKALYSVERPSSFHSFYLNGLEEKGNDLGESMGQEQSTTGQFSEC